MNPQVEQLYQIAGANQRRIIGLMSGTSLDGLDIALCLFTGSGSRTRVNVENFTTIPYDEDLKATIREIFAKKWIPFDRLTLLHPHLAKIHSRMILAALKDWGIKPGDVDALASHGQTVFHWPSRLHGEKGFGNSTLQLGDGDHLALETGILTLSDFRQKHIAAGGEGAPLALYGDCLLFHRSGQPTLLLNMGGIANFTYLPGKDDFADVLVTDTGPGNTLLDAAVRRFFPGLPYDVDGKIAASGTADKKWLQLWKQMPFFAEQIPKTTGPELFELDHMIQLGKNHTHRELIPADLLATLTLFSAETIAECIRRAVPDWRLAKKFGSGGGFHNEALMSAISRELDDASFQDTITEGIPGDAKEAVLFAVLANETLAGGGVRFSEHPSICMGKISFPG